MPRVRLATKIQLRLVWVFVLAWLAGAINSPSEIPPPKAPSLALVAGEQPASDQAAHEARMHALMKEAAAKVDPDLPDYTPAPKLSGRISTLGADELNASIDWFGRMFIGHHDLGPTRSRGCLGRPSHFPSRPRHDVGNIRAFSPHRTPRRPTKSPANRSTRSAPRCLSLFIQNKAKPSSLL